MSAPFIPLKFIKTLTTTGSLSQTEAGRFFGKLLYEFWGFAVNGNASTTIPGGFAAVSGVLYPSGFESGSTTLLAEAKDGQTNFGGDYFISKTVNFATLNASGSLIGKYLVCWKPGVPSTDDGVYPIIGQDSSDRIRVEVQVGGTRRIGNKSCFWKRDNVYFRIVDILAATKLAGWTDGSGLVLQFNAASTVNPGQASSQVKVSHRATQTSIGLIVSPSGSWNGLTFTDGTPEMLQNWFYTNAAGFGSFNLIGGQDMLMVNLRGIDGAWAQTNTSGMHIEIPKRLYSSSLDPNPVAFNSWANLAPSQLAGNYNNFHMVGFDGVLRPWSTLARCPWGTHIDTAVTAVSGGIWQGFSQSANGRYLNFNYNPIEDKFITSDAVLASTVGGQYSLARCRLRRVRFTSNNQFRGFRFGDIDWVFVANGVLWPWDNTMQGYGIQPEGL